jgi:integrase
MRYRVAKHKRGFVCVIYEPSGNRRRIALKASDKFGATAEAAELVGHIEQRKPRQRLTVGQIVEAYLEQSEAIWKDVDRFHWKHGERAFGRLSPPDVGEKECRAFAGASSNRPGSIRKVLSILRAALRWAERKALIDKAPHIWLPAAPPPKDRRLSREEFDRLETASQGTHHLQLFLWLARYTAARAGAILSLRWSQVDLGAGRISLGGTGRQKRRAVVPIHPDLAFALALSKEGAETDHVIEWAGKPVKSIKNAFRRAVKDAGLGKEVTPHVLRHTAASWMAEAGVPMSEIAAVLGHRDSRTTERVYARMSPEYLQKAVRALG